MLRFVFLARCRPRSATCFEIYLCTILIPINAVNHELHASPAYTSSSLLLYGDEHFG